MKTQEITLAPSKVDGEVFTIEKAVSGKAVILYNADHMVSVHPGLPAGCGLLSQLAEMSLIAAGMTVLGESIIKEMEIEILSNRKWNNLKAAARVIYSEEGSTTGQCDIRDTEKGLSATLVARAVGTIVRAERPSRSSH